MSAAASELLDLPLYDAALVAIDAAITQAELDLAPEDPTLEECVAIQKAFDIAERGARQLRLRGDKLMREAVRP